MEYDVPSRHSGSSVLKFGLRFGWLRLASQTSHSVDNITLPFQLYNKNSNRSITNNIFPWIAYYCITFAIHILSNLNRQHGRPRSSIWSLYPIGRRVGGACSTEECAWESKNCSIASGKSSQCPVSLFRMSWTTSGCADDSQIERAFLATAINQECKSIPNDCKGQYERAIAYSEVVIYLLSWSKTMAEGLDVRSRNAINLIFRSFWPLFTEQNQYTSLMGIHGILCT